uniref:hypothetical protein n=1 Tax=Prevotella sp. TaxID=59823 RepID=UPI0040264E70
HGFHTTRSQPKAKVGKGQWDGRTCCCKGNNYEQRFARTKSKKHGQGKAGQVLPEWHIVKECKMGRR